MDEKIYKELVELTCERARSAVTSTLQLMDDPIQRVALMIHVAADLTYGVAFLCKGEEDMSLDEALYTAVGNLCTAVGEEKLEKGREQVMARLSRMKQAKGKE